MALTRLTDIALASFLSVLAALIVLMLPAKVKSDADQPPYLHDTRARITLEDTGLSKFYGPVKVVESEKQDFTRRAYVTGYNTVPEQTDATPCDAFGGPICGRKDVVACPRDLKIGSWVEIEGKRYQCMDRTASKHDGRFDISCDKDFDCPQKVTGWRAVRIIE